VSETKERGSAPTASAKPIRPKKLLERPWLWIIAAGIVAGAVFAFGTSLLQSAQDAGGDAGKAFFAVASVGAIAVILMAIVSFYSFRKRRRGLQEHLPGTMMVWLKAHVWLGLAATFAILVHVWLYPWRSGLSSGKVTLVILLVLVASGIAWRIVYVTVPKRVPAAVGNLSVKDTRSRQQQIQVEIEKATAGASDELRRLAELLLAGKGKPAELDQQALTLSLEEQETWRDLKGLAERRDRYLGREPKQERYHRLLQGWKVLHLPLAAVLGAAIVFHVFDVFGVTKKVFANEADAFPDSGQCADCHSDIVREWMLAIHSSAQLTPTTVAQTALALEENPEIGQVCTNCHAPIGVQIAPSATFPLPGEGGDAILSDGVTCWTCHALPQAPGEIQGAVAGFPVNRAGARSFGTVFNPPLGEELPLPVGDHQVDIGFMSDPLGTFELCGACHNVKVDLADPSDGFSPFGDDVVDQRVSEFRDDPPPDTDNNGVLDENELQFVDLDGDGVANLDPGSDERDVDGTNKLVDLVLQTTFDEWEDFTESPAFGGETCGTCHLPPLGQQPTVDDAPGGLALPERARHSHEFIGVDYNLEPGHYAGLGVGGGDAREEVLAKREALISQAVTISARVLEISAQELRAEVTVRSDVIGHDFPSGFAFARQWWLEVTAETEDGREVCLAPVNPATFETGDPQNGIVPSACGSGTINSEQEDLRPCDPEQVASTFADDFARVGKEPLNATVVLLDRVGLNDCDPWLTNFQKILTDGDPDEDGRFLEVPYQSLEPDIVKIRGRVADNEPMLPLKPYDNLKTENDDRAAAFEYVFDTSAVRGQRVVVTAVMHLRHLPPYFLQELNDYYPNGLTAEALLGELEVSEVGRDPTAPKRVPPA
jgi:Cytochrome c554 and c-prime